MTAINMIDDLLDDIPIEREEWWVHFNHSSSDDPNAWGDRTPADEYGDANVYSSAIVGSNDHAPVLDIDLPARLVPSSTEGHSHLYFDVAVPWPAYKKLLFALLECGLVEPGYVNASIERGATFVRKPGVVK